MSLNRSNLLKTVACFALALLCSGVAEATTLTFKEKLSDWEAVDLGAQGPSIGDLDGGNGVILDLKGNEIGTFDFYSALTNIKTNPQDRWMSVQYTFSNGLDSIIIQGRSQPRSDTNLPALVVPQYFAITGGTGKYSRASGVCKVVMDTNLDFINTCKFTSSRIRF